MPKQQTHVRVVREWCVSLGVLTAISISRQEAEMKLAAYVPMLMQDFPDAAFTTESLHAVARECIEGFPPYPVLAARISRWWRDHRPYVALPPPPPPPPRADPTPEEIEAVHRSVQEIIAHLNAHSSRLDDARTFVAARHLTPAQLDQLNPLPNGRKRTDGLRASTAEAALSPHATGAFDPDTAPGMAWPDGEVGAAVAGDP